jgi:hypothetical protein
VLSTPPAFVLSQDQTLQQNPARASSDRIDVELNASWGNTHGYSIQI